MCEACVSFEIFNSAIYWVDRQNNIASEISHYMKPNATGRPLIYRPFLSVLAATPCRLPINVDRTAVQGGKLDWMTLQVGHPGLTDTLRACGFTLWKTIKGDLNVVMSNTMWTRTPWPRSPSVTWTSHLVPKLPVWPGHAMWPDHAVYLNSNLSHQRK